MVEHPTRPGPSTPPPAEMPLVHFTTRQLLVFVAAVSLICMILVSLDGYSLVVFSVGTILVAGHVLSTVIGGRLRATADATRLWELQQTPSRTTGSTDIVFRAAARIERPKPSELQVRTACSGLLWWVVGAVAACGGVLGAGGFALIAGPTVGWPGLLIGAVSAAMLVGWLAFIAAGVCGIARRSWRSNRSDTANQAEPDQHLNAAARPAR